MKFVDEKSFAVELCREKRVLASRSFVFIRFTRGPCGVVCGKDLDTISELCVVGLPGFFYNILLLEYIYGTYARYSSQLGFLGFYERYLEIFNSSKGFWVFYRKGVKVAWTRRVLEKE